MKKLILLYLIVITSLTHAQIDTLQDRPAINWSSIESDDFKVVFPSHMEKKANYVLNLLEFYKDQVQETYDKKTSKYTILIRSELAQPNGYVTLAPKRSEWYSASAIAPFVSSLEWYQSLAVHEYRHMVQFDYIKRPRVTWGYNLFGEFGQAVLMAITAPPWYFEGDAVWTETVYSNAGRGRSPRFSARLQSLLMNNEPPRYDEFIGGVYDTVIPNHYVFGYYLITRAYNKFGKKVWKEIISQAAYRSYNPYTFYNAFRKVTGVDFDRFYQESIEELQKEWKSRPMERNELYTRYEYPIQNEEGLYYLKWDLDSFWGIYKNHDRLFDLNVSPTLSKIDVKRHKLAYAQFLPDERYALRGHSDLFLKDLKTGEETQISHDQRVYHPVIHPLKEEVMAVKFADSVRYGLVFYDFKGNTLKEVYFTDYDVAEAVYIDKDKAAALLLDQKGQKHMAVIDLKTKAKEILLDAGRNNVYALRAFKDRVVFEAEDKGNISVFAFDFNANALERCETSVIAAYRPQVFKGELNYVAEIGNGQKLKKSEFKCSPVAANFLTDFDQYLGDGASTNFTKTEPVSGPDFNTLLSLKKKSEDYFEPEQSLTPHSWSFIGGRGLQLQGYAQNYLNTISTVATIGENADEARGFGDLSIAFKKYYPIFSLNLSYQGRNTEDSQWSEAQAGLGMALPYTFRNGLYSGSHVLGLRGGRIEVSNRSDAEVYEASSEQLTTGSVSFSTSYLKDRRYRELQPSWGYNLNTAYIDAKAQEQEDFSSYLAYGNLNLFAPGMASNHGLKLNLAGEYRTQDPFSYRILSPALVTNEYAFSRGYTYEYVDSWQKASLNYVLPLAYPNASIKDYNYTSRIYSNLFVDHTKIMDAKDLSLNSAGFELYLESLVLRKLPLTYGLRVGQKLSDDETFADFLFSVNVGL